MNVRELMSMLAKWPAYASVEIAVPRDLHDEQSEPLWMEIVDMEAPLLDSDNNHCLIFAGKVTMY